MGSFPKTQQQNLYFTWIVGVPGGCLVKNIWSATFSQRFDSNTNKLKCITSKYHALCLQTSAILIYDNTVTKSH